MFGVRISSQKISGNVAAWESDDPGSTLLLALFCLHCTTEHIDKVEAGARRSSGHMKHFIGSHT